MAGRLPFPGAAPGTPTLAESVPTAIAIGPDGAWYVSELGFPIKGTSRIWRIEPGAKNATCDPANPNTGKCTTYATGFTSVIDLAFGPDGTMYVLEIVKEGLLGVEIFGDPPIGALWAVDGGTKTELAPGTLMAPAAWPSATTARSPSPRARSSARAAARSSASTRNLPRGGPARRAALFRIGRRPAARPRRTGTTPRDGQHVEELVEAEDRRPEVGPLHRVDDGSQRVEDARGDEKGAREARGLDDLRESDDADPAEDEAGRDGTQRGASSQNTCCTMASAAPIQTTREWRTARRR